MRLDDIVIVLARPSEPGNTGAVCRAMKNMGLSRLRIAAPVYQAGSDPAVRGIPEGPDLEKLLARAVHAPEIWENARRFDRLEEALADCAITVGTTRRRGRHRKSNTLQPRELAEFLKDKTGQAAIVFGNERTGLDDEELALCNLASHIPVNPEFPSVNLSHAVQIYAYELYQTLAPDVSRPAARTEESAQPPDVPGQWVPMTQAECTALARRISASLGNLGFYRHPGREEQERFLRDVFSRAGLTLREGRYLGNIAAKAARLSGGDPRQDGAG
ncbi:MAG: RNA methyltransferase [Treponema sp.]|jgi:tRNA/rRNA methyltransferase/tRNA (cytidine32/uridine32-2'-O)-methyltransferase|nr:RNA methyltransferase [Treponema sp.]